MGRSVPCVFISRCSECPDGLFNHRAGAAGKETGFPLNSFLVHAPRPSGLYKGRQHAHVGHHTKELRGEKRKYVQPTAPLLSLEPSLMEAPSSPGSSVACDREAGPDVTFNSTRKRLSQPAAAQGEPHRWKLTVRTGGSSFLEKKPRLSRHRLKVSGNKRLQDPKCLLTLCPALMQLAHD